MLTRVEELGTLAHELHAAQHESSAAAATWQAWQGRTSRPRSPANGLDLGSHIIVRENHGVALGLETLNGRGELGGDERGTLRGRGTRTHAVCDELRELLGRRIAGRRVDAGQPGPSRWEILGDSMARVMSGDKTAVKTIWPKGTRAQRGTAQRGRSPLVHNTADRRDKRRARLAATTGRPAPPVACRPKKCARRGIRQTRTPCPRASFVTGRWQTWPRP